MHKIILMHIETKEIIQKTLLGGGDFRGHLDFAIY